MAGLWRRVDGMTINTQLWPLALMANRQVREANEAGDAIAVLTAPLDRILWADVLGRKLLGLPSEGSASAGAAFERSTIGRQIRTAGRPLAAQARARVLLRSSAGVSARPLAAELVPIDATDAAGGLVLLRIAGTAPRSGTALAEKLLGDMAAEDGRFAVFGPSGVVAATSGFRLDEAPALPSDAEAFLASDDEVRTLERDGVRITLGRVSSAFALVKIEPAELPAPDDLREAGAADAGAPGEPDDAPAGEAAPAELPALVREARRPVGNAFLKAMNMSALVQRWHRRQDDVAAAPEPLAGAGADDRAPTGPTDDLSPDFPEPVAEQSLEWTEDGNPDAADGAGEDVPGGGSADVREDLADLLTGAVAEPDPAFPVDPPSQDRASPWIAAVLPEDGPSADGDAAERERIDVAAEDGDGLPDPKEAVAAEAKDPVGQGDDAEQPGASMSRDDGVSAPKVDGDGADGWRDGRGETALPAVVGDEPLAGLGAGGADEAASLTPHADEGATTPAGDAEAVPSDGSSSPDAAQPIDGVTVTTLPDLPFEDADRLDLPISVDEEAPPAEKVFPSEPPLPGDDSPEIARSAGECSKVSEAEEIVAPTGALPDTGRSAAVRENGGEPTTAESRGSRAGMGPGWWSRSDGVSAFTPRFEVAPVRFVWQIDRHGCFRSLSPEFAAAVGPRAADVIGRSFREISQVFGLEGSGEIIRLLDRRDTWSGRSILWPVENSDRKAPIDLAALPVYARDRSFDGFRGFGIVRMNEAVLDGDAIGLVIAGRRDPEDAEEDEPAGTPEPVAVAVAGAPAVEVAAGGRPLFKTYEADLPGVVFGRRQETPQPSGDNGQGDGGQGDGGGEQPKVIRIEERRRSKEGTLSQVEEAAFRAIGMKLGNPGEAENPSAPLLADGAAQDGETTPEPVEIEDIEIGAAGQPDSEDGVAERPAMRAEATDSAVAEAEPSLAAELSAGADAEGEAVFLPVEEAVEDEGLYTRDEQGARGLGGEADSTIAEAGAAAQDRSGDPIPETLPLPLPGTDGDGPSEKPAEAGEAEPEDADPSLPEVLDRIFASLPLPILVQAADDLVYANREFQELTGYESVETLRAAGGLGALFLDRDEALTSGGLTVRRSDGRTAVVSVHLQRVTFAARSCLLMSFVPDRSGDAVPAHPVSLADPVPDTEADDLRQQVEELHTVLDTATDGIVLLDPAGNIRAMNGSADALFGIGQNGSAGRHLSSLFAVESQKATVDYLETLRDDGLAGIMNDGREVIGRVAQGGFIPLFITIGRLSGDRGWCVVIRDIAHWKRIEEDLVNARRQAEAASLHKSRFLANISHELRTPLNAIIGFADVMASECFGPIGNERYIEYLGDIKRSGHHVLDLVNVLLDISKIEAGKLDLTFEAVSLNEVVSEVVSLMQPQANRERVIVRSNLPSSVPPVVADRRTMRQIALNLIANAIRFTPSGGQIIASTTYTAEGDVLLRFRDSGIGMTEREIEIALTPFQQVHAPSANRGEGTGLGLPLTKAMVEANRAHFAINSVPGEGTLVEISFPSQRVLAD